MSKLTHERTLYLCGGLQGSGSSLISWCFLQRRDMDGVFDTAHDMVPRIPDTVTPRVWCKITTCCFQTAELHDYFCGLGWSVRPLLVVRDVREVWSSLQGKQYGRNGTTAEDPPLRLRMLRFLSDWRRAMNDNWAVLAYESLVNSPVETLKTTCDSLDLPWDQDMADWPKSKEQIADARYGNVNFLASRAGGILKTVNSEFSGQIKGPIAQDDHAWLESTFSEFNRTHGYPLHRSPPSSPDGMAMPSFDVTRRANGDIKTNKRRSWLHRLGRRLG